MQAGFEPGVIAPLWEDWGERIRAWQSLKLPQALPAQAAFPLPRKQKVRAQGHTPRLCRSDIRTLDSFLKGQGSWLSCRGKRLSRVLVWP